ncbi:hypothetical protein E4O73_03500 [Neisseria meningitidis]|nr:hypothetical protein [Neisseria meningitidis]
MLMCVLLHRRLSHAGDESVYVAQSPLAASEGRGARERGGQVLSHWLSPYYLSNYGCIMRLCLLFVKHYTVKMCKYLVRTYTIFFTFSSIGYQCVQRKFENFYILVV